MNILIHVLAILHSLGITLSDVTIKTWPSTSTPEQAQGYGCVAFTGAEGHVITCPSSKTIYIVPVRPST